MTISRVTFYAVIALMITSLFMIGCSKKDEVEIKGDMDVKVGEKALGSFPKDIPVYPDVEERDESAVGKDARLSFITTDSFQTVISFYDNAMAEQGWEKAGTGQVDQGHISVSYIKEKRTLHLMGESEPGAERNKFTLIHLKR